MCTFNSERSLQVAAVFEQCGFLFLCMVLREQMWPRVLTSFGINKGEGRRDAAAVKWNGTRRE